MEILTVGHSTHPIERFVELLSTADVDEIADVRRFPGSRRNPQFGAEALAETLAERGIAYQSFAESLGGRRSRRADSDSAGPDNSGWRNASFRAYADYMSTHEFAEGLRELERSAAARRVAIMCAEGHPSRCHRQLIADALVVRGWTVVHLLDDGRQSPHELSAHAAVDDRGLSYPGPPRLEV